MEERCGCGSLGGTSPAEVRCARCAAPCCPSCGVSTGARTYCSRCADSMLDPGGLGQGRSTPAAWIWTRPAIPPGLGDANSADEAPWVVVVARDQPDLFAHLERAFARDAKVEIVIDRRKEYSRNPPGLEDRLRIHGAAVIRRHRV
jgi:hypothetical protein